MGLEPLLLLFKICFRTFHQKRRDYFGRGAILSGIIVLRNILMNASVSYCALPEGLRILGKVLSVDINSPGAQGFTSKHWQSIFIQLLVLSMGQQALVGYDASDSPWPSGRHEAASQTQMLENHYSGYNLMHVVQYTTLCGGLRQSALTRTDLRHQSFWSTLRKRSRNLPFITVSLASWRTQAVLL